MGDMSHEKELSEIAATRRRRNRRFGCSSRLTIATALATYRPSAAVEGNFQYIYP